MARKSRKEKASRAMVRYAPPPPPPQTAFATFVSALMALQPDWPIPQMLADSLWRLILHYTKEAKTKPPGTERELADWSERVDHLLNTALIFEGLVTKNPLESLAERCREALKVGLADQMLKLTPVKAMEASAVWGQEIVRFLAPLLQKMRLAHEGIQEQRRRLQKENATGHSVVVHWIDSGSVVDSREGAYRDFLNPQLSSHSSKDDEWPQRVAGYLLSRPGKLDVLERELAVAKTLPVGFGERDYPADFPIGDLRSAWVHWLMAQMMIVMSGKRVPLTRQYVNASEYIEALRRISKKQVRAQQVADDTVARLKKMGWKPSQTEGAESVIRTLCEQRAARLIASLAHRPNFVRIGRESFDDCLTYLDDEDLYVMDAAEAAQSSLDPSNYDFRGEEGAKRFQRIEWANVEPHDFEMIADGSHSVRALAEGILQMKDRHQPQAVQYLLRHDDVDQASLQILLDAGKLRVTPELVQRLAEAIPQNYLEAWLEQAIRNERLRSENSPEGELAFRAALELPAERLTHMLFDDPELRENVIVWLVYLRPTSVEKMRGRGSFEDLRKKLPEELFRLAFLAERIFGRGAEYEHAKNPRSLKAQIDKFLDLEPDDAEHPWESPNATEFKRLQAWWLRGFRVEVLTAPPFSEEAVFRWIMAKWPDLDDRWQEYCRRRDIYQAAFREARAKMGKSPPPRKKKKR